MKYTVTGFPRIGEKRELKFAAEKYFRHEISAEELKLTAKELRLKNYRKISEAGCDTVPVNDFSFYDGMLDTAFMLNAIPDRFKDLGLNRLDTYFAAARGYQDNGIDAKALAMKKWFNTNYHYMVPELEADTDIRLSDEYLSAILKEAVDAHINARPVIIGPFTFLMLSHNNGCTKDITGALSEAYAEIFSLLKKYDIRIVQFDEPYLGYDLDDSQITLFHDLYDTILKNKGGIKVLLTTYFGDIRDCYSEVMSLPFDAVQMDFIEGIKSLDLLKEYGFPDDKTLYAGVINGKNVWKADYTKKSSLINEIKKYAAHVELTTSCSLLHVPYTLQSEEKMEGSVKARLSYAYEKLDELRDLSLICGSSDSDQAAKIISDNQKAINENPLLHDSSVTDRVSNLSEDDFIRKPDRNRRLEIQHKEFNLPLFPTTTIGSFPQTKEVRSIRAKYRKGEISEEAYKNQIKAYIKDCIKLQEEIGLDVLVHGEYERNDMVEYFGEHFNGFIFTQNAWVQSYGTRCVKPPVIFGDVSRSHPVTVEWIKYAASLTDKPVKAMLTGPVTIFNWSFPREDISAEQSMYQIGLAIRDEASDLEAAGIKIIQVDEAAFREKLPLRKADWHKHYLDYAIRAFRLVHSGLQAGTQLHTHMCYSEFTDIIPEIDDMDADVITFEASRSNYEILDYLAKADFQTEVGPGIYDIHSPRIPSVAEMVTALKTMSEKIGIRKLWVNPDCGLKTRGIKEAEESLKNMVAAAEYMRKSCTIPE
ncbi:MAG: 5-methyltetrahydropteroyltriglutamate--homocysteine S-methyltransferase [Candidatus Weimeria sp.]